MPTIVPVLLAGGEGTRLPLNSIKPKQFLKLNGEQTLLQDSVTRAMMVAEPEQIITIASEKHRHLALSQLQEIHPDLEKNIILEPCGRNTAAAVISAAIHAANNFEDPILWIIPSDHMIVRANILKETVQKSLKDARQGKIVLFGINPTRADSNYGYIIGGERLYKEKEMRKVLMFMEKPTGAPLEWAMCQQNCMWNSGMFLLSAATLFTETKRQNSTLLQLVNSAYKNKTASNFGIVLNQKYYFEIQSAPIDKVIMEKSKNLVVTPVDIGWADVGSWQSLWEMSKEDGGDALDNFLLRIAKAA
jgi:mannose-1-phosphate guanylyltransferase/mannose-6-phosphate isomerase